MTQRDLARAIGISQPTICRYFSGILRMPAAAAEKIEAYTGISRLYWLYPDQFGTNGKPLEGRDRDPNPLNELRTPHAVRRAPEPSSSRKLRLKSVAADVKAATEIDW